METDLLKQAYERMCLIRNFELRLNDLFLQGAVAGTTHLCVGQEACAVGVSFALEPEDCVFSNHRGHGHLIGRGAKINRVMGEIFGSPIGYAQGRGGSQHMAVKEINFMGTHGITAGTIPLAVGVGLHKKRMKEAGAGVVFFGDGAIGEGIFHESMNMASIWKLPVLFVCENNLYAMSTSHEDISPVNDIVERAKAYSMKHIIIDGNKVDEVYEKVREIREQMITNPEPWFIELKTFRVSGHSRGDKCEYRSREEEDYWDARDPIAYARKLLEEKDAWSDADETAMQTSIDEEIAAAEKEAQEVQY
ncbi:MAG: thiamine pyrophosphate-dependent dehydrogenase E1 component subunit alpha [Lentisphaeria bacterium]|nr:thiamine pyrophosphate-dependent dehydrogenase E1 component subunit alpha [Lentisphaeria bacterium]NQZ70604.1 thiamine pyrophosphate-dependent dehydrogenase E1 component subunit alpha [Lentisphaeria bacterium]